MEAAKAAAAKKELEKEQKTPEGKQENTPKESAASGS